MKFPSKVVAYSDSVLAGFPVILACLMEGDASPSRLYQMVKRKIPDIGEFAEMLDCLYALGQIEFNEMRGELHYVGGNQV